jgi:hypothetical protein
VTMVVTVKVVVKVKVTLAVTVELIVVVIVWSTLIFKGRKTGQGKRVITSFRLVSKNTGSWRFL